jgi:hypothetical protein
MVIRGTPDASSSMINATNNTSPNAPSPKGHTGNSQNLCFGKS